MEARGDTDTYESDLAASRVVMELSKRLWVSCVFWAYPATVGRLVPADARSNRSSS
jgi:hypothetical protein